MAAGRRSPGHRCCAFRKKEFQDYGFASVASGSAEEFRCLSVDGDGFVQSTRVHECAAEPRARPRRRRHRTLAGARPPEEPRRRRPERVRPGVQPLLDAWHNTLRTSKGRSRTSWRPTVSPWRCPIFTPGNNILRSVLLDPAVQEFLPGWQNRVGSLVAALRVMVGPDVDNPRLTDLVGELSVKSDLFRRLWSRHDAKPHPGGGVHRLRHPIVGDLELHYEKFAVTGTDGQLLVVYHAEPGSPSADALALLGSLPEESAPRPPRTANRTAPRSHARPAR